MALSSGFEKHAIIGGSVDSFCLVCNSHLRTDDEVIVHIEKPVHKKNLDSAQFNKKYKEDKILKVCEGYFCMFCCRLISTIRKVAIHIEEPQHNSNKGVQLLKRFGGVVTAFDNISVTNAAWGGIIDGSCAICNVEVTDGKLHETETVHVLNLIRKKVEFGEGHQIYREVDDDSIYCITCNEMFSNDDSKSHFNELEHMNKLEECKNTYRMHKLGEEKNNSMEPFQNSKCTLAKEEIPNIDCTSSSSEGFNSHCSNDERDEVRYQVLPISKSLDKFKKNGIYIDIVHYIAYCEKCAVNVDFNCKAINKHIEEHGKSYKEIKHDYLAHPREADTILKTGDNSENDENDRLQSAVASQDTDGESDKQSTLGLSNDNIDVDTIETLDSDNTVSVITDDLIIFAKANMLTYNKGNSNAYCRICEVRLPANMQSMKEHVSGKVHKKTVLNQTSSACANEHRSTSNTDETFIKKTSTNEFVNESITFSKALVKEVIINYKFCLEYYSFHMITKTGLNLRCQTCEKNLAPEHMEYHVNTASHNRAAERTPILTSLYKEFVREVRPGVYHCGFCNLVVASWDNLQLHLACSEHSVAIFKAEIRLILHMPAINRFKLHLRVEEEKYMRRRMGFPFF